MKLRNIALYLTLLLAVTALPLFAQSAASSGTAGGKATQTSKPMSSATSPSQKIDINSATKDELARRTAGHWQHLLAENYRWPSLQFEARPADPQDCSAEDLRWYSGQDHRPSGNGRKE